MTLCIGFTGSREEPTAPQLAMLGAALGRFGAGFPVEFHHGDCIGCDACAHRIAKDLGWRVIIHPADIGLPLRAFMQGAAKTRTPLPALLRNLDIVSDVEVLVACPADEAEIVRSGTWQTIRAARKAHRRIIVCWPSGRMSEEPEEEGEGSR